MNVRIASGVLWFLAGWAVGAVFSRALGISQVIDPLVGAAWAALIVGDPRHILWRVRAASSDAVRDLGASDVPPRQQVTAGS